MKHGYLWLTLRLMRKQKLRTWTIFCGILFSGFLLSVFGGLGYNFWNQVHEGTSEAAEFDSTQWILIALVLVLLLLVSACSVILLHNLFSLTFMQKWRSLSRLMTLGAVQNNIIFMMAVEIGVIYCMAAPLGPVFAFLLGRWINVKVEFPFWMLSGILIWILVISCICGIRPALLAIYKPPLLFGTGNFLKKRHKSFRIPGHFPGFAAFMAKKYYLVNRGHYNRIILTIVAVIVLYVPVSYLINTNLYVQHEGLYQKYGIQYTYTPQNYEELMDSLEEYRDLTEENMDGDSMVYVSMFGIVSVKSELLSRELLGVLSKAGWNEKEVWETDSMIYFLEDACYETYLSSCSIQKTVTDSADATSCVLVNQYINRSSWKENGDKLYPKTSLLNTEIWKGLNEDNTDSGIKIYCDFSNGEVNEDQCISPDMLADELPEGIDFTGKITLILPLSQFEVIYTSMKDFWNVQEICGQFEDYNEELFDNLQQRLGSNGIGNLRYTRKIFREWYDSMNGIHMAMTSICVILFFIALLNIFSTMIFQYIERKHGLAVLWSLGQSENGLLKILVLENIRNLVIAIIIGIPVSGILCYYIYSIFRYVWRIDFILPFGQIILIILSALMVSVAAILIDWRLMKHQNFLQDIRDIT